MAQTMDDQRGSHLGKKTCLVDGQHLEPQIEKVGVRDAKSGLGKQTETAET